MSIAAAAIRQSIKEVMQGQAGEVRTVDSSKFGYGVFDGQPTAAQQARAIQDADKTHRFDIKLGSYELQAASPLSSNAPTRNIRVPITIGVWTTLRSTAQEAERDEQRDAITADADEAIQALSYRGNLTQDSALRQTNIVSGLLQGPDGKGPPRWRLVSEDWKAHLLRSEITASAIVVVTQPTSVS